jgi:2',3'-cyclic-nucleotide 2'-phosphodiesterase/3'-nucleotidase
MLHGRDNRPDDMTIRSEIVRDLGPLSRDTSLVHLRLLATSDLHAMLMPFDYFTDSRDDRVGLVRVAGMVEAARAEAPNCLLLDNGDTFQGGALGDLATADVSGEDDPHPMLTAMNAMDYDAATLGNHDFDFGVDVLSRVLLAARFPIVLANAQHPGNGEPFQPRHVILEREVEDIDGARHPLRIGVTGTVPPQVAQWNATTLKGQLVFEDAVTATAREAGLLKAAGADIVIVLAHSGLGDLDCAQEDGVASPNAEIGMENVARRIAALPDVDVVVAGHTHEVYPPDGVRDTATPETPIVQPGFWGSHLGCIDLAMSRPRKDPTQCWTILKANSEALPLHGPAGETGRSALKALLRTKPDLRRSIGAKHRQARRVSARQIGESDVALHTFFSTIAPCRATQLMSDAQRFAARELLRHRTDLRDLPLISAVSPMRTGSRAGPDQFTDIAAGPILLRHVSDLYCYPNTLSILRLRGRDIPRWLERAASVFHRIDPADPRQQPLINHDFAGYNFDRLDGLTYQIDVSMPAATDARGGRIPGTPGRIRNLCHADGTPVDPDEDLLLVTNSYRASGGGDYAVCADAETLVCGNDLVRDTIVAFIKASKAPIHPMPGPTFSLRGFGRAQLIFETGAGALRHESDIARLGLSPIGMSDEGFLRLAYEPPIAHR